MTSDDITPEERPYNPLDKKNLGVSVADAVLAKTISPLPPAQQFNGAGIYAIYYTGNFPIYGAIALRNRNQLYEAPIYVGKAVPAGARKGGFGLDIPAGPVLYRRLCEHAQSIEQTSNLNLKDFHCRCLVVDDIWIPLGESLLIEMFSPIWNKLIDGFGNHDPGSGRHNQQKSPWDVLHPGRSWAEKLQPYSKSEKQIISTVEDFLRKHLK